jgi:hypothetical protein
MYLELEAELEITVRVCAAMLNNLRKWMVEDHVTPSF